MDEKYKNISSNAKILYSLFLNRTKFSKKNTEKFSDKNGVFIYYSNSQIKKHLCCSVHTAINSLNELEKIGLIRKEHQKRGLPLKIYVNDIRTGKGNTPYYPSQTPQDKPFGKPYSVPTEQQKPRRNDFTKEEKSVSFDTARAQKMANDGFLDFGEMKRKKRIKHNNVT